MKFYVSKAPVGLPYGFCLDVEPVTQEGHRKCGCKPGDQAYLIKRVEDIPARCISMREAMMAGHDVVLCEHWGRVIA